MTMVASKSQKAYTFFKCGYNCAQAVFCAYAPDYGIDEKTATALSASFGGGMGRMRLTCGAVSAMFMLAGLHFGEYDVNDNCAKAAHYERIQELARRFERENASITCATLLGLQSGASEPMPEVRNNEYYKKRPCADLVRNAAEIFECFIKE